MSDFSITEYVSNSVENIVKSAIKATLTNPDESIFMAKFAIAAKSASKKRAKSEKNGVHIPAFLIASITSSCNLHCAGCYSRANHACSDSAPVCQLTADEWKKIFTESEEIGVSFRTCSHRERTQIFKNNFADNKAKKCRNTLCISSFFNAVICEIF